VFSGFFKRKKQPAPSKDDWEQELVWLPVAHPENPFPVEVLDCRAVALTFLSTTSDKSVAECFNRLRASDGREMVGCTPDGSIQADCILRFHFNGQHNDGPIFLAREMEDKWDFFAYDSRLYVRRSWTGVLTHVAELEYSSDAVVVHRIYCEQNTAFGDPAFAVAQLYFLISTHLGRTLQPFPIPKDFPRTAGKPIALMAFNSYGRRAQFGAYLSQGKTNAEPKDRADDEERDDAPSGFGRY